MTDSSEVTFLNASTCGIYKDGGPRFKRDAITGARTSEIDNELADEVDAYLAGRASDARADVNLTTVFESKLLVPMYYDLRFNSAIEDVATAIKTKTVSLGRLLDEEVLQMRTGHGSPGNDQRQGHIPYVKVSDIRGLRVNINPTNLLSQVVAEQMWRGTESGLLPWDVITPSRASSNIGEFAMLLPGEHEIVLTREVFILRVNSSYPDQAYDPFYLLWALSLASVRDQWRRIALMQTNREDCGHRYREIRIPEPLSPQWARDRSRSFRAYFNTLADAKERFVAEISDDPLSYVANIRSDERTEQDLDE